MTTLRVIKAVREVTGKHFERILDDGAFPEINWERHSLGHSFSLFEYSDINAQYMKLVDKLIKEFSGDKLGVFTRKHSKVFLADLEKVCADVTESDIIKHKERFRSFADEVRGSI